MVTMKDVAKYAGVSVATVSNVITNKKYVSEEVRLAVLDAIDVLNYKVNLVARGLKSKRSYMVGVILPDITKIFFPDVLKGIEDSASESNYTINFLSSMYSFKTEKAYVEHLKSSRVDGIIIDSCCKHEYQSDWAKELVKSSSLDFDFPVVSLEQELNRNVISSIKIDNFEATRKGAEYLIGLGRKDIIYITAPLSLALGLERLEGYKEAMRRSGLPVREEYILKGNFLSKESFELIKKAIRSGIKFDAVMAANDQSAIGALIALKESNINVPNDVAIFGFDNLFPGTLVTPQITTIDVPRYKMGYEAFKILLDRIANPKMKPVGRTVDTKIIERQSTNKNIKNELNLIGW